MTDTQLLRKREAAALLGISTRTLGRLVARKKVTALKPSPGCVRFRPVDLQRYLSGTATRQY